MLKPFVKLIPIVLLCSILLISPLAMANGSILVLGDSLSAAYKMMPEEGWVNLLNIRIQSCHAPYEIINLSTSGDTTRSALQKLPLALEQNPTLVIIELGGNDGLRGLPLIRIKNNLKQLIEMSLEKNAKVLLAGMKLPPNYGKAYNDSFYKIYVDLAENYDIHLLPFILEDFALDEKYMLSDGIHPNKEAQPLIVDKVWSALVPILDAKELNECDFNP